MKFLTKSYIGLIFFLLYIPILVLIVFSFNESGSLAEFTGVSTVWYEELFHDEEAFSSLRNSLVLAVCSSLIATVIGTLAAEMAVPTVQFLFLRKTLPYGLYMKKVLT